MISRDDVAHRIFLIWSAAIGSTDIHHDEGFFDVGGDSLMVAGIVEELCAEFPQIHLSVLDMFRYPTIDELTDHITAGLDGPI